MKLILQMLFSRRPILLLLIVVAVFLLLGEEFQLLYTRRTSLRPTLASGPTTSTLAEATAAAGATAITAPALKLQVSALPLTPTTLPALLSLREANPGVCADNNLDCRLLFTSTGRSGTHFLVEQLNKFGLEVAHEDVGPHGSVSWFYAATLENGDNNEEASPSSSSSPLPPIKPISSALMPFELPGSKQLRNRENFRWFPVVHFVRHPLSTIGSIANCLCGGGRFEEGTI